MPNRQVLRDATVALVLSCSAVSALGCAEPEEADDTLETRQGALTCVSDPDSAVTLYVATNGKSRADGATGTCGDPFLTLQDAEDEIDARDTDVVDDFGKTQLINSKSYAVYMREGTYAYVERSDSAGHLILDQVNWRVASSKNRIRITAYPGERPVFDGRGIAADAIKINIQRGGCGNAGSPLKPTLLEISNLTFRHVRRARHLREGRVRRRGGRCRSHLSGRIDDRVQRF